MSRLSDHVSVLFFVLISIITLANAGGRLCFASGTEFGYAVHCSIEDAYNFSVDPTPLTTASVTSGELTALEMVVSEEGRYGMFIVATRSANSFNTSNSASLEVISFNLTDSTSSRVNLFTLPSYLDTSLLAKHPKVLFHPGIPYYLRNESHRFCYPAGNFNSFGVECGASTFNYDTALSGNLTSIDFEVDRTDESNVLIAHSTRSSFGLDMMNVINGQTSTLMSVPLNGFFEDSKAVVSPSSDFFCAIGVYSNISDPTPAVRVLCHSTTEITADPILIAEISSSANNGSLSDYDIFFSKNGSLICFWAKFGVSGFELRTKCIAPSIPSDPTNYELVFNDANSFALETASRDGEDRVMLLVSNNATRINILRDSFLYGNETYGHNWFAGRDGTAEIALTSSPFGRWFALGTTVLTGQLGASDMWTAPDPFALRQFKAASEKYTTYADMKLAFSPNGDLCRFSRDGFTLRVECHVRYIMSNVTEGRTYGGSYQYDTELLLPGTGTPVKNYFTAKRAIPGQLSLFTCVELPLSEAFLCTAGVWTFSGDLNLNFSVLVRSPSQVIGNVIILPTVIVDVSSSFHISGNLTLQESSTILVSQNTVTPLVVTQCMNATGSSLVIVVNQSGSQLAEYSCYTGRFSGIEVKTSDECDLVTSSPEYSESRLIVSFVVDKGGKCRSSGLSTVAIIGIIVGVVAAAGLAIAVVLGVPQVRKKVFPYRNRERHVTSKTALVSV